MLFEVSGFGDGVKLAICKDGVGEEWWWKRERSGLGNGMLGSYGGHVGFGGVSEFRLLTADSVVDEEAVGFFALACSGVAALCVCVECFCGFAVRW